MRAVDIRTVSDRASYDPIMSLSSWNKLAWTLFLLSLALVPIFTASEEPTTKTTVAIIGGGVAGTFASKYLVDYDAEKMSFGIYYNI